jgi:ABC-type branched-subunit amino acid transport system substrate-binding protein
VRLAPLPPLWRWVLPLLLWVGAAPAEPYRDLSTAGSQFLGPTRELPEPDHLEAIRIGVTGPSVGRPGGELLAGVQLAVDEANAGGGYRGLPYEVVFRPDDGPWGVVARQVVRLASEDEVWVIIGSLDGERAHAAELVAAKLWVPVIATASDYTIDYANVPWVFRILPDDLSQVTTLLDAAGAREWRRLGVVAEDWRDARQGARLFERRARQRGMEVVVHSRYDTYRPREGLDELAETDVDALCVWGRPGSAVDLIPALRRTGATWPLLLPTSLAVREIASLELLGDAVVAAPYDLSCQSAPLAAFRDRWRDHTGEDPGYMAPLAYDAACQAIAAIQRAGLNRARIRDELMAGTFVGLTGPFPYSSLGGRQRQPVPMGVADAGWVPLSR